ncbi:MAG: PQQ-binding-like beta-propeller repeat protein [bacterium]|nr:PQQ-binding-like beta-propeller repeat protein [bacterium]
MITELVLALSSCCAAGADDEAHWPTWRGPHGTGVAESGAPLEWTEEDVRWKVEIPGRGFSTPIVWGEHMFLTTAIPIGEEPEAEPEPERGRRGRFPRIPLVEQAFEVLCINRTNGEVAWRKRVNETTPHEGYHFKYGSYASLSPITDGKHLYASFGSYGLFCLELDAGEVVWKRDFGVRMEMRRAFGEGSAPVIAGDKLIQVFDHEGDSFIVAVERETGEEAWRKDRDEPSSWATPLVVEYDGVQQVVVSGSNRVRSYRTSDGKVLWECGGLGLNVIPAPQRFGDTVLVMSGYRESNLMAIQLGAEGDLTDTDKVSWSTQKGLSYTPSPVLHDGKLYAALDRGFLSCFDAKSGEGHYVETRLPRGSTLKASPVAAGDRLYIATEAGDVHVVKMGPEFEVLATNSHADQFFVSSPVVVEGNLYLRSQTHLFCVGAKD